MREIKFRGKTINGEWVYGDLIHTERIKDGVKTNHTQIGIDMNFEEVIPETVGQFTGLKDKNEVDTYEGDILEVSDFKGAVCFDEEYLEYHVKYNDGGRDPFTTSFCKYAIVGNIYDNPELIIKGGK